MAGPGFFGGSGNEAVTNPVITETLYYDQEHDLGTSSAVTAWDMTKGNKMKVTLDDSPTITFLDDPDGPSSLLVKVTHSGGAAHVVSWPATVKWPGGNAPTLSAGDGKIDLIGFYFDGTNYYGNVSLNFS